MSMVQINWNPDATELRKFGVAMIVGFGLIGGAFYLYGNQEVAKGCFIFGAIAGALGLTGTRAALPVYLPWMAIAFVMGNIMSRVLLALIFYTLITLIGTIRRILGVDKLQLKRPSGNSYWKKTEALSPDQDYEKQF